MANMADRLVQERQILRDVRVIDDLLHSYQCACAKPTGFEFDVRKILNSVEIDDRTGGNRACDQGWHQRLPAGQGHRTAVFKQPKRVTQGAGRVVAEPA